MNQVKIPNGDEKVTIELTVKELMALTGVRFRDNRIVEVTARKKLNEALEEKCEIDSKTPSQLLN